MSKPNNDFHAFVTELDAQGQLQNYAQNCGTTANYLLVHLRYRRKIPRHNMMARLAEHSNGRFSFQDLLEWFYNTSAA